MKKNLFLLVLLGTFGLLATSASILKKETIVIKTTIYCDHCKECESCGGKLDKELYNEKGIKEVVLDEKAMTITVTYDPAKTTPDKIRQAISKMGYDADHIKADPAAVKALDGCCKKP